MKPWPWKFARSYAAIVMLLLLLVPSGVVAMAVPDAAPGALAEEAADSEPELHRFSVPADLELHEERWYGVYVGTQKVGYFYESAERIDGQPPVVRFSYELVTGLETDSEYRSIGAVEYSAKPPYALVRSRDTTQQGDKRTETAIERDGDVYRFRQTGGEGDRDESIPGLDVTLGDHLALDLWLRQPRQPGDQVRSLDLSTAGGGVEEVRYRVLSKEVIEIEGEQVPYYEVDVWFAQRDFSLLFRVREDADVLSVTLPGAMEFRRETETSAKDTAQIVAWFPVDEGAEPGATAALEQAARREAIESVPEIGEERMKQAAAEVAAAYAELYPDLDVTPTVRFATKDEVVAILSVELERQLIARMDADTAKNLAEAGARAYADALLAKYAFDQGEILVLEDNIRFMEHGSGFPLTSPEALRGLLAHEFAHALDEHRHGISEKLLGIKTEDAVLAANALIEGNAQFIARRICENKGWMAGFEAFTEVIGFIPDNPDLDAATRHMVEIITSAAASAYYQGETFIAALHAAGGDPAVAGAFESFPAEMALIYNPGWFLDPSSRPVYDWDLDRGLGPFESRYEGDDWLVQKVSAARPQLEVAFNMLPVDDVAPVLDGLMQNRMIVAQPKANPMSGIALAGLYEFNDRETAEAFLKLQDRTSRKKDELMAEGETRIVDAQYTLLDEGDWTGLHVLKQVAVADQEVSVASVVAVHDRIGVEMTFSNMEIPPAEMVDLVGSLLKATRGETAAEPEIVEPEPEGAGH
ncbi:hypothetical protein ABI59_11360 [Acidobacteria bacterium Mor1]|nr:hypothetical protein ABI59_11360 [Acidobacteria bacterium Mor1]